jgi:ABC-type multidrug transport system fused ATPase/permease subunit
LRVILPPLLFLSLLQLIYGVDGIKDLFYPDGAEPFLVPFGFWIFIQRIVVQIMYEKSSKLQESMRMMGLSDAAYWISYFIFDGCLIGLVTSFLCAIMSVGGLFNDANFGVIFGMFLVFCLSATTFAFFLTAFFDTPQTSGQATLGILLGFYVIYVVIFPAEEYTIPYNHAQLACAFFPPLALQMASGAFLNSYGNSYDVLSVSSICAIMLADIPIYAILAWYFSQVWPSKIGVRKPFYFPFVKSYWFPKSASSSNNTNNSSDCIKDNNNKVAVAEVEEGILEQGERGGNVSAATGLQVPVEDANESLLGPPTVKVEHLMKTFGTQKAVNNLSFKMYENQIFALLGHNGAGKVNFITIIILKI